MSIAKESPSFDRERPMRNSLTDADYRAFFEALGKEVISSATDARGDIIYANDRFVEVSKYDRSELIGHNHRILKSGHHTPEFYKNLWKTISSGCVWRGEIKNRAKDGSYYWVDTSIAPIFGADGRPEKYVSVRFLITEQKDMQLMKQKTEESLREERQEELKRLADLEKFQKITVGRELRMIELKNEIEELKKENETLRHKIT